MTPQEQKQLAAVVAELGALPMPVGPGSQAMSATRFAEIRNRRMDEVTAGPWLVADGAGGKPVVYVEEPLNGAVGARVLLAAEGASEADVQFVASARRSVSELVAEVERLVGRVAELESERHSTNEALDDAVAALRAREPDRSADELTRLFAPTQALREDEPAVEFFQPGLTYQRARWQFQCLTVAPDPFTADVVAVGFLFRKSDGTSSVHRMREDDWAYGEWVAAEPGGGQ